jgi:hypothetical protein
MKGATKSETYSVGIAENRKGSDVPYAILRKIGATKESVWRLRVHIKTRHTTLN